MKIKSIAKFVLFKFIVECWQTCLANPTENISNITSQWIGSTKLWNQASPTVQIPSSNITHLESILHPKAFINQPVENRQQKVFRVFPVPTWKDSNKGNNQASQLNNEFEEDTETFNASGPISNNNPNDFYGYGQSSGNLGYPSSGQLTNYNQLSNQPSYSSPQSNSYNSYNYDRNKNKGSNEKLKNPTNNSGFRPSPAYNPWINQGPSPSNSGYIPNSQRPIPAANLNFPPAYPHGSYGSQELYRPVNYYQPYPFEQLQDLREIPSFANWHEQRPPFYYPNPPVNIQKLTLVLNTNQPSSLETKPQAQNSKSNASETVTQGTNQNFDSENGGELSTDIQPPKPDGGVPTGQNGPGNGLANGGGSFGNLVAKPSAQLQSMVMATPATIPARPGLPQMPRPQSLGGRLGAESTEELDEFEGNQDGFDEETQDVQARSKVSKYPK